MKTKQSTFFSLVFFFPLFDNDPPLECQKLLHLYIMLHFLYFILFYFFSQVVYQGSILKRRLLPPKNRILLYHCEKVTHTFVSQVSSEPTGASRLLFMFKSCLLQESPCPAAFPLHQGVLGVPTKGLPGNGT